ncbi:MAG: hypothetical protein WCC77_18625 [Pseudolabrys sp.]
MHIESNLHPRLRAVSDLCQNDIAAALHHPQHFRAGLAPVVGVLHPLQTDGAVEVALWNVARVGPGPGSDLTAAAALLRDVVVASLVGYVEDLDLAARPDPIADVVGEAAGFDAFADNEHFVAFAQFKAVVDQVARDLRLAPHEGQTAEQNCTAPALLLFAIHDDLADRRTS